MTSTKPVSQAKITHPNGMTRSHVAYDYTLCPSELVKAAITRFTFGLLAGHERDNWKKGAEDLEAIRNTLNHGRAHYDKILDGTGSWEDVEAVICNLAMVCWWKTHGTGLIKAFPHLGGKGETASH